MAGCCECNGINGRARRLIWCVAGERTPRPQSSSHTVFKRHKYIANGERTESSLSLACITRGGPSRPLTCTEENGLHGWRRKCRRKETYNYFCCWYVVVDVVWIERTGVDVGCDQFTNALRMQFWLRSVCRRIFEDQDQIFIHSIEMILLCLVVLFLSYWLWFYYYNVLIWVFVIWNLKILCRFTRCLMFKFDSICCGLIAGAAQWLVDEMSSHISS